MPDPSDAPPQVGSTPVVVCCADENFPLVSEAVTALRSHGLRVELVSGVEADSGLLATAIKRLHAEGLYVLCRSPELPRARIDRLREVLLDHRVPFGRTLTIAVESRQPRELEDRVRAGLRRLTTRIAASRPEPTPRGIAAKYPVEANALARTLPPEAAPPEDPPPPAAPTPTPAPAAQAFGADPAEDPDAGVPTPAPIQFSAVPPHMEPGPSTIGTPISPLPSSNPSIGSDDVVVSGDMFAWFRGQPGRIAAVAGIGALVVIPLVAWAVWPDAEPEPTAAVDDGTKAKPTKDAAADNDGADEPEPTPIADPGPTPVALALQSRDIRALDILLVAPKKTKKMGYADASAYCDELEVAGIDGWRLPKAGELNSLTDAAMTGRDSFWSVSEGDTWGDTRIVFNARRRRMSPRPTDYAGARAICVKRRG